MKGIYVLLCVTVLATFVLLVQCGSVFEHGPHDPVSIKKNLQPKDWEKLKEAQKVANITKQYRMAVAGQSGIGKSSLINLILRMRDQYESMVTRESNKEVTKIMRSVQISPGFEMYDTKGIIGKGDNLYEKAIKIIEGLIKGQFEPNAEMNFSQPSSENSYKNENRMHGIILMELIPPYKPNPHFVSELITRLEVLLDVVLKYQALLPFVVMFNGKNNFDQYPNESKQHLLQVLEKFKVNNKYFFMDARPDRDNSTFEEQKTQVEEIITALLVVIEQDLPFRYKTPTTHKQTTTNEQTSNEQTTTNSNSNWFFFIIVLLLIWFFRQKPKLHGT